MNQRLSAAAVIAWCTILVVMGCSTDTASPELEQPHMSFLQHVDMGCLDHKAELDLDSYLVGYTVNGDTLTLTTHFWSQCAPQFDQDIFIDNSDITIVVRDTAYDQTDCLCNYENRFSFYWDGTRELSLHFEAWSRWLPSPSCEFDTLVVVTTSELVSE